MRDVRLDGTATVRSHIDPSGSVDAPVVAWMGDWAPRGETVLGVGFVIDPIGAGMASLGAGLVAGAGARGDAQQSG